MTTEPQLRHHPDAPEVIVASTVAAAPGHAVAIPVEVRHRGPRAAHLRVTVFGLDARWIPEPLDLGMLQPGESASIQVTVIPERGAMGAHYPFTIAAEATAVGARPVVGVAESVLALGAAERISMTITPPLPAGAFSAGIRVDITNPGDDTRDLTLLPDSASGITVRLRDKQVSVPGRRTVSVKGRVRVRKPTITGGHNTHTFTIAAQGTGAPEQAEATMRSRPLIGGGLRRAIALGLVIVAWIGLAIVFIPKISDRFKQKNDVASVVQTEDGGSGSGSSAGDGGGSGSGSGSGAGSSDGSGGAGSDGAGSGGAGSGSGSGSGSADGSAAAGGYQLSGTVTGPAAEGSFVTLAPVALAGIDDGSLPQTQSTDQSPRAFRSSASDAIGKTVGPLAPAPRDGFRTTTITTGEKGEFTFSGVTAPGYYLLTIAKKGFTSQRFLINSETLAAPQPLKVELVPGEGSLSGRVIGPDGSAIGAATIVVTDGTVTLQTSSVSASTQTGTPGTWSLDQVSTPGTYLVTASSPGLGSASKLVTLDASGKGTADLTLTAGLSSISGKVSGEDGLGQVGGLGGITVTATGGDVTRTATTVTAAAMRGAFVLPNLPAPGTYTLTFSGQGYLTQTREVTLGASAVTVNTTLSRADAVVSGMISGRDENGKAEGGLGGVGLTLASNDLTMKTMTTSGDGVGSFQFVGVPPGTYVLTATQFGRTSASTTVELKAAASKKVNLLLVADLGAELPANAHIRGQVTDSRTSGPLTCDRSVTAVAAADCVATVTVSAPKDPTNPDAGTVTYTTKATSALNFVYTIPPLDDPNNAGLPPGLYTVRITAPGYEDAITHVQVAQGQTAPAPPASLPALGIISGTVTTRVDKPSQASCVLAVPVGVTVPKDLPTSCTVATGGNTCTAAGISGAQPCALTSQGGANEPPLGTYQIRGLKHGQYQMVLISQDPEYVYTVGTVPIVTLELGADGQFNAVLDRLGRINVSVVKVDAATGSPVPVKGASISATKQTGDGVASAGPVTSDDNGIAILKGLDGTYKVSGSIVENTETITADATADPTGLNQTANVTLVIAKQSGPLVGRVVVDGGDSQPTGVGGVTVTVSGTVGYQGSTASTGSAQVTTDADGCYAIVPANWDSNDNDSLSSPQCPNSFTPVPGQIDPSVGTLKNLLTGQPATLISDRVDVSVAALAKPAGTTGTWTETYPATGQAIADCDSGCGNDGGRMIPNINVKPSPMSVGSLTIGIAGPNGGFTEPVISSLHFIVLSKPSNAGGVSLSAPSGASWTEHPDTEDIDGVTSTVKSTDLTFLDPQYGTTTNTALPGRYKFQVTLTDFVDQNVDLVCPFMAAACFLTSANGTTATPVTLLRLPAISVQINLPSTGPEVSNWSQASVSQTGGPTLSQVTIAGSTPKTGKLQFDGDDSKVVTANTSYSFSLTIPGYGVSPVSVTCGANYRTAAPNNCAYSSELTALPKFPDTTVQLDPSKAPGTAVDLSTTAVTGTVTSPSNLANTILITVDDEGKISWKDSRSGVNDGQVMPGDYTIVFRRAGFVDTTVELSCTDAACSIDSGAISDDPGYTITMPMLPRPVITVEAAHVPSGNFTFGNSTFTVDRDVNGNWVRVTTASLSLGDTTVDGAMTATAPLVWLDTAQPFAGIAGQQKYRVTAKVDGFAQDVGQIDCTPGNSCTTTISLTANPSADPSDLKAIKLPGTTVAAQFTVISPSGVPAVSLTDDGSGNLTWQQGTAPENVIAPTPAGAFYRITASLSGYDTAVVDNTNNKVTITPQINFTCIVDDPTPSNNDCTFPKIVLVKATTLTLAFTDGAGQHPAEADFVLEQDGSNVANTTTTSGNASFPGRSMTMLAMPDADDPGTWADTSYTLDVKAAGYGFATGLSFNSSEVICTNGTVNGGASPTPGLRLFPGGTTTCTVTLQKLGTIAGTTAWQHNFLAADGGTGDTEARCGVDVTATLLKDAHGNDPTGTAPSFTMRSVATQVATPTPHEVCTFNITGDTDTAGLEEGTWKIEAVDSASSDGFEAFSGVVGIDANFALEQLAAPVDGLSPLPVVDSKIAIVLEPVDVHLDVKFKSGSTQADPYDATIKVKDKAPSPTEWQCVITNKSVNTTGTTLLDQDDASSQVCSITGQTVQFAELPPGSYTVTVDYDNPGYSTVSQDYVVQPTGADTTLEFEPGAQVSTITGALADSSGTPITAFSGDARVELWKWTCQSNCIAQDLNGNGVKDTSLTNGQFTLNDVVNGQYRVVVIADGYAFATSDQLNIAAGTPWTGITIRLTATAASSATIQVNLGSGGADNSKLSGMKVTLQPADTAGAPRQKPNSPLSGTIDGTGLVSIPSAVPTGTYKVVVGPPDGGSSVIPFSLSTETLVVPDSTDAHPFTAPTTLALDGVATTLSVTWADLVCATGPTTSIDLSLSKTTGDDAATSTSTFAASVDASDPEATTATIYLPPGDYSFGPKSTTTWELAESETGAFTVAAPAVNPSVEIQPTADPTVARVTVTATAGGVDVTDGSTVTVEGITVPGSVTAESDGSYCLTIDSHYKVSASWQDPDNGNADWSGEQPDIKISGSTNVIVTMTKADGDGSGDDDDSTEPATVDLENVTVTMADHSVALPSDLTITLTGPDPTSDSITIFNGTLSSTKVSFTGLKPDSDYTVTATSANGTKSYTANPASAHSPSADGTTVQGTETIELTVVDDPGGGGGGDEGGAGGDDGGTGGEGG